MNESIIYQKNLDTLMENYIDTYDVIPKTTSFEFIISSNCNQKCEYCYLYKHGKEMYPEESLKKENILRNLKLLLHWLHYDKNFDYREYDIFSGEFFALSFWEDVLQVFYDFHKEHVKHFRAMTIPSNGSFVLNEKTYNKIIEWNKKLKEIDIELFISVSIDGGSTLEEMERPFYSTNLQQKKSDDVFYNKIVEFSKQVLLGFHPMITKNFVKNYKENYDWWTKFIIDNDLTIRTDNDGKKVYNIPMFLEVRDENQWDDESIENYRKFLWYAAEQDLKYLYNDNKEVMAERIFNSFGTTPVYEGNYYTSSQPYFLSLQALQSSLACSIQNEPKVRVGDLMWVPCHRTCYPQFNYGQLVLNEEKTKIIGVKGLNPMLAYKIKTLNPNRSMLKCNDCKIKAMCLKGCLGAQYEQTGELFAPIESVCKLFQVKQQTIHEICKEYSLYDIIDKNLFITPARKEIIDYAKSLYENSR